MSKFSVCLSKITSILSPFPTIARSPSCLFLFLLNLSQLAEVLWTDGARTAQTGSEPYSFLSLCPWPPSQLTQYSATSGHGLPSVDNIPFQPTTPQQDVGTSCSVMSLWELWWCLCECSLHTNRVGTPQYAQPCSPRRHGNWCRIILYGQRASPGMPQCHVAVCMSWKCRIPDLLTRVFTLTRYRSDACHIKVLGALIRRLLNIVQPLSALLNISYI